jgi:tetratricopeptide (TPR) repeat protein
VISALKSIGIAIVILMLATGGGAFAYGRWSHGAADADAALSRGQLEQALAAYATAEARFDRLPVTKQLFSSDYHHVVANELWLLYRLGRYNETIDKAERAPDAASPHLWAACAFFEKARREEKPDARLGWLTRAEEEFRRAVEGAPEDWDSKYDFELTTRLAAELRKQPKTPPKQLMQLLRPPMPTGKPTRRVG